MEKVIDREMRLDNRVIDYERYMYPRGAKSDLLVLVEADDDVYFWRKLFRSAASNYKEIIVCSLKSLPEQKRQFDKEGHELTATGKEALMQVDGLGASKVIAVDADYDLIIDNYHKYTQRLRTDPFIIHTEYYAIENHLISPYSLCHLPLWNNIHIKETEESWNTVLSNYADSIKERLERHIVSTALHRNKGDYAIDCSQFLIERIDPIHYEDGHELYSYVSDLVLVKFREYQKDMEKQIREENVSDLVQEKINSLHILLFGTHSSYGNLIHDSFYSSDSLDMEDSSIKKICDNIKKIYV